MPSARTYLLLPALWGLSAAGQLQHNTWHFGSNAGVSFTTGGPVAFTGSAMNAFEGSSSMSDANGNTLFYTNGEVIWDRTHAIMPNGSSLGGALSSCQGVVIVPFPGSNRFYYIFTVPAQIGQWGGYDRMCYSVVDMSLHGGLGDILELNVPLVQHATEQVTAAYHTNGRDVWVLTRVFGTGEWYAYPITCTGIGQPVVSVAGLVVEDSNTNDTAASLGTMDVSKDGTRIASVWNDYSGDLSFLELFHFDASTGSVTGGDFITHPSPGGTNTAYGVCFSPGGSALYMSEFSWPYNHVWQYDMSSVDPLTTEYLIATGTNVQFGALEAGRDGRIYHSITGLTTLARIEQPEVIGTGCTYVDAAIDLGLGSCSHTLSNDWIHTVQPIDLISWQDTIHCAPGLVIGLTDQSIGTEAEILWSTGSTGDATQVNSSGTYTVLVAWPCDTARDTVHVVLEDCSCDVIVPNVFSPNGDAVNDRFPAPFDCDINTFDLTVRNRWGNMVFHSSNAQHSWNGGDAPEGVYFYTLRYAGAHTAERSDHGTVMLVR